MSAYNAIERLREKEYIEKNDRKIVLTDRGREVLNEYMTIIRFMSAHLSLHCGTTENQAYEDALALGEGMYGEMAERIMGDSRPLQEKVL